MHFAPPSYSEDRIRTCSFHTANGERLSMVLPTDNVSIDGVVKMSNTFDRNFLRQDSQINASIN
ncbi:hypothetical protein OnM2_001024 [Erysiphe neolycopersici]|uniref:Uncharacterized protein n=1 Tax=Erysiphe neolycopersici TaxID=212602 RepID=A0A420I8H7_9PEZI|nr:hypothetical protein OnM2_001024 [Erysiphe neolycopersici]